MEIGLFELYHDRRRARPGSFGGDGGPAAQAALSDPVGLALDEQGNLYIADAGNHRVRKVEAGSTIITTIAGAGAYGSDGDGGPALQAELFNPHGIALDRQGNLYIADYFNHRVRKVEAQSGLITTIAGTGARGYHGDGMPATEATCPFPVSVAVGGTGDVFVVTEFINRIRKVEAASGLISTVAGAGTLGYSGDGGPAVESELAHPHEIVVDGAGNLYIADTVNSCVRKVEAASGLISTVAGAGAPGYGGDGGPAGAAALRGPRGLALDEQGNLFIVDTGNHCIRKVDAQSGLISTVAGAGTPGDRGVGGPATSAELNLPKRVVVDGAAAILYIADAQNNRVCRVEIASGLLTVVAGIDTAGA